MGITERRNREKLRMRRSILDAAMKLFVEDGYDNVSIRKIAKRIEYSPATIYLYFTDKDEIFFQLHQEAFSKFLAVQKETLKIQNPMARLAKQGANYLEFAQKHPEHYDLMFIIKAPLRKLKTEWNCGFESFDILRQTIAECIDQGHLGNNNVDVVAIHVWANVHGLASLIIRDRLAMIPEDLLPQLLQEVMAFGTETLANR